MNGVKEKESGKYAAWIPDFRLLFMVGKRRECGMRGERTAIEKLMASGSGS
jgi:hypothetical protein